MLYNCEMCGNSLIISGGRHSTVNKEQWAKDRGWENDEDLWYCPDHKLKTYTFTATQNVAARSESDAIDTFSHDSYDFAAKAECQLLGE